MCEACFRIWLAARTLKLTSLYRFRLPSVTGGNTKRIYTLGSRGRDFLANEVGLPVTWYFRPDKVARLSYGQLMHNLVLTRFLVSARVLAKNSPDFAVSQMRTCYELDQGRGKVTPDAWIMFERTKGGARNLPVLVEIDRGTEYKQKFMERLAARVEFIKNGEYRKMFGTEAVRIAYATTGETPEGGETRRRAMIVWTKEVLVKMQLVKWGPLFQFASVRRDEIYESPLFERAVWYRPDSELPVGLFAP